MDRHATMQSTVAINVYTQENYWGTPIRVMCWPEDCLDVARSLFYAMDPAMIAIHAPMDHSGTLPGSMHYMDDNRIAKACRKHASAEGSL